jgi:hypothetical protein
MKNCCKGWRLLFIPLIAVAFIAFGYVTMYLWNWLMPELFHLPLITFWQAAGILILSRLLFGFGGHHKAWTTNHHNRSFMREKWEKMSPEEREKFKGHFSSCCSGKTEE